MPRKKGRHPARRGPGGPAGPGPSGRVTAPRAPANGVTFRGPSLDGLVGSLLASLRAVAPAGAPGRAIGVELWADRLAATVYGPEQMPAEFYGELADGLLAADDPDARLALAALAHVLAHRDATPLRKAHAAHRRAVGAEDPSDLGIGRATPARTLVVSHVQGDGVTILVDVDQPGAAHSVGAYVDHNLAGLAQDLFVGPPIAQLEAEGAHHRIPDTTVTEIDPADARARIESALRATDHAVDPPVTEDVVTTRALVERRLALLPTGAPAPLPVERDEDEIPGLIRDFLAAPEAASLSPDERQEADWIAELWLDHATSETIGGPLRLSPTLVEIFCAEWYPRIVGPDHATAAAAPAVLAAWVRYAARVSGLADRWRDEALAAVDRWAPEMGGEVGAHPSLGEADPAPRPLHLVALDPGLGGIPVRDESPAADDGAVDPETPDHLVSVPDQQARDLEMWGDGPHLPAVTPTAWRPLQSFIGTGVVPWDVDDDAVVADVATKVKSICLQAAHVATALLGPAFVPAAADLVVRIGEVEPSPLPHTQDRAWAAAILWLLVSDSGGFDPSVRGRRPDDLAADLGLKADTIARRAAQIRDLLDLPEGTCAVSW